MGYGDFTHIARQAHSVAVSGDDSGIEQRADQLLDEEWITFRLRPDHRPYVLRDSLTGQQCRYQRARRGLVEGIKRERRVTMIEVARGDFVKSPRRLVALRPKQPNDQEHGGIGKRHQLFNQIKRRAVRPMEILEHEHHLLRTRQSFNQAGDGAEYPLTHVGRL